MYFRYKALSNNKMISGRIEAQTEQDAIVSLRRNNYFPVKVTKEEFFVSTFFNQLFDRTSYSDIVNLTRQLAIMLNAGLTLIDAFVILRKQITKESMIKMIDDIERTLRDGKTFSEALKRFPDHFSRLYISLVKSGEASGKLNDVLLKLADSMEKQREFRGKLKSTLAYPAFIIGVVIIVMFIMMTFVLPQLLDLFKSFQVELPIQTQILIAVSNFFAHYWILIIVGSFIAGLFIRNYLRTSAGKYSWDATILKLPIIGKIATMTVLIDTTHTLSVLISSGVSILESITIIIDSSSNSVYQNAFKNMYVQVERGVPLGQAFINVGVFPPLLVQMVIVGEQTGHLDETLIRVSRYFEAESEIATKTMTTFIEPSILVLMGVGIGFLVYSIITPIYSLTASIH